MCVIDIYRYRYITYTHNDQFVFMLQAQFTLVFFHSAQVLIFDCGYPKLVGALLLVHSTIFFVLFFDFYRQAYRKSQKKTQ